MIRPGCELALAAVAACSANRGDSPPAATPPPPRDAGVADGITAIGSAPPGALDPDPPSRVARPAKAPRPPRPIEIILRSTPPGAHAAVDGADLGVTPATWFGDADGAAHEFTFVLRGHAVGRYRFVPVQSGVVHARLVAIHDDAPDAGVSTPETSFAPAPRPVPPPPTVVSPPDAGSP